MDPIPFIDAASIRAAVGVDALLDAVEAAYRDVATGRDRSPLRTHVALDAGDLLLMPGVREGGAGTTVKLVTIVPGNADRGLPTIHAVVAWIDATTGAPLALLDGATITAMRTGAASGVATRLLAREDAATLAIVGAGGQAEWQIRAVVAARPIRRVLVATRHRTSSEPFAERMAAETGLEIVAADSVEAAVREADVCAARRPRPCRCSMRRGSARART